MSKVIKEMIRLADLEQKTREWIKREGIDTMFQYYYDQRRYTTKKNASVTMSPPHLKTNTVSAAMNISNYTTDNIGSEIADHTFKQDCAWRRRMHIHNSRANDIEKVLAVTPLPLGRFTTKKHKRATTTSKKRHRKQSKRAENRN